MRLCRNQAGTVCRDFEPGDRGGDCKRQARPSVSKRHFAQVLHAVRCQIAQDVWPKNVAVAISMQPERPDGVSSLETKTRDCHWNKIVAKPTHCHWNNKFLPGGIETTCNQETNEAMCPVLPQANVNAKQRTTTEVEDTYERSTPTRSPHRERQQQHFDICRTLLPCTDRRATVAQRTSLLRKNWEERRK